MYYCVARKSIEIIKVGVCSVHLCAFYLQSSLLRFVDHLRAVPQDVAVQNLEVLNVVLDDIGHLGFIFSNHHSKIPLKGTDKMFYLKWNIFAVTFALQVFVFAAVTSSEILNCFWCSVSGSDPTLISSLVMTLSSASVAWQPCMVTLPLLAFLACKQQQHKGEH